MNARGSPCFQLNARNLVDVPIKLNGRQTIHPGECGGWQIEDDSMLRNPKIGSRISCAMEFRAGDRAETCEAGFEAVMLWLR